MSKNPLKTLEPHYNIIILLNLFNSLFNLFHVFYILFYLKFICIVVSIDLVDFKVSSVVVWKFSSLLLCCASFVLRKPVKTNTLFYANSIHLNVCRPKKKSNERFHQITFNIRKFPVNINDVFFLLHFQHPMDVRVVGGNTCI